MLLGNFSKHVTAAAVFAGVVVAGMLVVSKSGQAANDNNGAQDEKQMIQIGLSAASSEGITLSMSGKDQDMVGLGSYLVNVSGDCNGCHSAGPSTAFAPGRTVRGSERDLTRVLAPRNTSTVTL